MIVNVWKNVYKPTIGIFFTFKRSYVLDVPWNLELQNDNFWTYVCNLKLEPYIEIQELYESLNVLTRVNNVGGAESQKHG